MSENSICFASTLFVIELPHHYVRRVAKETYNYDGQSSYTNVRSQSAFLKSCANTSGSTIVVTALERVFPAGVAPLLFPVSFARGAILR